MSCLDADPLTAVTSLTSSPVRLRRDGVGVACAALCYKQRMDKTVRKYATFDELKADEYRYWQSRPVHERVAAVSELTQEHYALKGEVPNVPGLQRTVVHFERPPR